MEKSSLICIVPDSALGCKHLDKIDIKRKDFSALKSGRVQKKQKILTSVPLNKDFWCILIEKRKNHFLFFAKICYYSVTELWTACNQRLSVNTNIL